MVKNVASKSNLALFLDYFLYANFIFRLLSSFYQVKRKIRNAKDVQSNAYLSSKN